VGNFRFRNNIVENLGSGTYTYPANTDAIFWPSAIGAEFDHNLFHGNHPASEPGDAFKLTSDPLFVSPPASAPYGIGNVGGYKVQATSPAVGSGAVLPENGGLDYFGDVLSATAPPTRGFHEAATFAGPATLIDGAIGFYTGFRHSSNVSIDTSGLPMYGSDASRFSRAGALPATVTWLYDQMKDFDAAVYQNSTDPSVLTFWVSPDGLSFTEVTTSTSAPVPTSAGWSLVHYTGAGPLTSGSRFLMAQITTAGQTPDATPVTSIGVPPQPPAGVPSGMEIGGIKITSALPAPALRPSPSAVAFPATKIGRVSAPVSVAVANTGKGNALGSVLSLSGPDASSFWVAWTSCGDELVAGGSCSITLVFAPSARGSRVAKMSLTPTNGSPAEISLQGVGGNKP
jgi:hypothetical protein